MKAEQTSFLKFLGTPDAQFLVPPFQRVYSWTLRECKDLWESIEEAGASGKPHFTGTILYSDLGVFDDGIHRYQIVDGQQRLTTLTLILIAYSQHKRKGDATATGSEGHDAAGDGAGRGAAAGSSAAELRDEIVARYLITGTGDQLQPKLLLTSLDAGMLAHLLGLSEKPEDLAERLSDNLAFFQKRMQRTLFDPAKFMRGLELLDAIAIQADPSDAPQEIFESLNSKGKRLAIEDLVRNSMLLTTPENADPQALYEQEWLPLERSIEETHGLGMEELLCSWIASNHDREFIDSKSEVYPLFKADLANRFGGNYRSLLNMLSAYAKRMITNDQFRQSELTNMDRWLQGKPKHLISERRIFGD